jgi:hypothetical protein
MFLHGLKVSPLTLYSFTNHHPAMHPSREVSYEYGYRAATKMAMRLVTEMAMRMIMEMATKMVMEMAMDIANSFLVVSHDGYVDAYAVDSLYIALVEVSNM